jgi:hypothetical protein
MIKMTNQRSKKLKFWLFGGGIGFGLYLTAGFALFKTFRKWNAFTEIHYLAVASIFVGISVLLAWVLFGAPLSNRLKNQLIRWFLLPTLAFTLGGLLIYLYFGLLDPRNYRSDILLPSIVRNIVLLGLLPVQAVLILMPQGAIQKPD